MKDQERNKKDCKAWYLKNREKKISKSRELQKKRLLEVQEIKLNTGCQRCGYNKCARALQFHHEENNKEHTIARMVAQGRKLEVIRKEIDKCSCLCSNCHAEVHDELARLV